MIPAAPGATGVEPGKPRTCGVYSGAQTAGPTARGSSPHTRGLRHTSRARGQPGGIIPAHAGFTRGSPGCRPSAADHPRTRGVYMAVVLDAGSGPGSSPHTRGLQAHWLVLRVRGRIIPAHAGFTVSAPSTSSACRDHPRTRGVYWNTEMMNSATGGSSPHTRGLPVSRHRRQIRTGIIPAHAGFTLGDPWNPNGPGVYHPPVSFTADLVPARRSCGSAAVEPRWTTTPWAA